MSYPGFNGLPDIRNRVATLEQNQVIDVSGNADGLELVGQELRLNYRDLPLAPES